MRTRTQACEIGRWCNAHAVVHGGEAEELRRGIEKLIEHDLVGRHAQRALQQLLDDVDARDSLAFIEAPAKPCSATTKKGHRCSNTVSGPTLWCHVHSSEDP